MIWRYETMRTTDITLTNSEAYTVCDILNEYIEEHSARQVTIHYRKTIEKFAMSVSLK